MRYVLNTLLHPNINLWRGGFGRVKPGQTLPLKIENITSWNWPILVIQRGTQSISPFYMKLTLKQKFPSGWVDTREVESLLNLWLFSLDQTATPSSDGAAGPSPPKLPTFDSIRLLGSNTARTRWDILKWYIDHWAQVYEVQRLAEPPGEEFQSTEPSGKEVQSTEPPGKEVQFTVEKHHGGVMGISAIHRYALCR